MNFLLRDNDVKLIGRFYFKKTLNGNLIGEYSNNSSFENKTEGADILDNRNDKDSFSGKYKSTWFDKKAISLNLIIDFKEKSNNTIYKLIWEDNSEVIFYGEGFVVDDILIGDYRNFELK